MTDLFATLEEIDAALRRTRRIAANLADLEDLRVLEKYIFDLERQKELVGRPVQDATGDGFEMK